MRCLGFRGDVSGPLNLGVACSRDPNCVESAIGVTFLRSAVDEVARERLSAATVETAAALTSRLRGR